MRSQRVRHDCATDIDDTYTAKVSTEERFEESEEIRKKGNYKIIWSLEKWNSRLLLIIVNHVCSLIRPVYRFEELICNLGNVLLSFPLGIKTTFNCTYFLLWFLRYTQSCEFLLRILPEYSISRILCFVLTHPSIHPPL